MRIIVTGGGLLTVVVLFIMINCTIISRETRQNEVEVTLDSAMEYAIDLMGETYRQNAYDGKSEEDVVESIMEKFCKALSVGLQTDGDIKVRLLKYNIESGLFHVQVEENFKYQLWNRDGVCMCEKTVVFR